VKGFIPSYALSLLSRLKATSFEEIIKESLESFEKELGIERKLIQH